MNHLIHRALQAYRPLYQRGQLLDGQYRLPLVPLDGEGVDSEATANLSRPRRRILIAALAAAAVGLMARFDVARAPHFRNARDQARTARTLA